MPLRILGYSFVVLALGVGAYVAYRNSPQSNKTLPYSPQQTVNSLWTQYKANNLEPGTFRTLDKQRGSVTTSEGQSYTMLRAVWMGDKETFDASWKWTEENLARPNDHLFSWLWGARPDGSFGVLTQSSGQNSASDADTNIALALIFAYSRWQDPHYLEAARPIVSDIWDLETLSVGNRAYVLADNLEKSTSGTALINPSYLSPAAYRIFAAVDTAHPWRQAVDGAYVAIAASADMPIGDVASAGLPADWLAVDTSTGELTSANRSSSDANFGYDALRVPWNLALDYTWFQDPRDLAIAKRFSVLADKWEANRKLYAAYTHDGAVATGYGYETPAMYGGTIGYFMLTSPKDARDVYEHKLLYLFTPDWSGWRQSLSYFDDNWAWFGIALYTGMLPNLAAGLPASFFALTS